MHVHPVGKVSSLFVFWFFSEFLVIQQWLNLLVSSKKFYQDSISCISLSSIRMCLEGKLKTEYCDIFRLSTLPNPSLLLHGSKVQSVHSIWMIETLKKTQKQNITPGLGQFFLQTCIKQEVKLFYNNTLNTTLSLAVSASNCTIIRGETHLQLAKR